MGIYNKLLDIQKSILGLKEDKKSFGYNYLSGSKLLSHIKPLMNEHGVLLKQEILTIDNERQDYSTKKGDKSEILTKITMKFTWVDVETGEVDENLFAANGQNDWEKGLGSALTYGERYFLLKYFHISTDKDDIDNPDRKPDDDSASQAAKPSPKKETKPEAKEKKVEKKYPKDLTKVKAALKDKKEATLKQIKSSYYLTKDQANELLLEGLVTKAEIKDVVK